MVAIKDQEAEDVHLSQQHLKGNFAEFFERHQRISAKISHKF